MKQEAFATLLVGFTVALGPGQAPLALAHRRAAGGFSDTEWLRYYGKFSPPPGRRKRLSCGNGSSAIIMSCCHACRGSNGGGTPRKPVALQLQHGQMGVERAAARVFR